MTFVPPNELQAGMPPCGALTRAGGSVCWRVWSPLAQTVELALYPEPGECRVLEMKPEPGGYFVHTESDVEEGQRYAFRIDHGPERPDPMSRWQPEGVHRPSAVIWTDRFDWSEGDWAGLSRKELVIYELHVGTFTPEGTFDAMTGRLEELRELGVTALELMPVAQFPGTRGWGYEGVYPFAVQNSYGGPRGLQRLVERLPSHGFGRHPRRRLQPSGTRRKLFRRVRPLFHRPVSHAVGTCDEFRLPRLRCRAGLCARQRAVLDPRLPRRRPAARRGARHLRFQPAAHPARDQGSRR